MCDMRDVQKKREQVLWNRRYLVTVLWSLMYRYE